MGTDNEESSHAMNEQPLHLAQRVANYTTDTARSREILLSIAECQQESDRIQQETRQIQQANAQQIAANAQAIAELRAALQDRYSSNG